MFWASRKHEKYVDKDLKRAFAGRDRMTAEGKRMREIRPFIEDAEKVSLVLDLHSISIENHQLVAYNIENTKALRSLSRSVCSIYILRIIRTTYRDC